MVGETMGNLADIIEKLILHKLANECEDIIVLKRNEMAEEIECAPSQISYVLSTRFTMERGFIVESKRGSGGFVRIERIPVHNLIYEDAADKITEDTMFSGAVDIVKSLAAQGMLTGRESGLILHFFDIIYEHIAPEERSTLLRSLLLKLSELT
jgi:transcriptional regulator CtsR